MEGPDTAGREHDEDEIWRDIVARLGVPDQDQNSGEKAPWPPEEGLTIRSDGVRVVKPADPSTPAAKPGTPDEPQEAGDPETLAPCDDEHYVPPPPPPLPRLDPITKGAWLALFGGPGYLLATTVAGWTVPAWAAFVAVAAFVGGFITLVVRMSDDNSDGSGSDDGAVV